MEINIGLVGLGTIGGGVVKIINKSSELIEERTGIKINLKKVCDKNLDRADELKLNKEQLTDNYDDLINDSEIDIIIELIGGYEPARTFVLKAIEQNKHVVTANKALIAKHGPELFDVAKKNNVNICFEASVGGCIPILRTIKDSLVADNISAVYGILNGTTNYILTKMNEEGQEYQDALKKAQELGFAEADPTFDVEGMDSCQKLSIVASIAYNSQLYGKEIYTEGITKIDKVDMKYADELGYVIKLLAIAKNADDEIELRVHPTMISKERNLAKINNEINGVYIIGDNIDKSMLVGKGAGEMPTASTVISDVVSIANRVKNKTVIPLDTHNKERKIKDMDEIQSRYYLRFSVEDKPGVLASIAKVMGENNLSIDGVLQQKVMKGIVPLVMTTHSVKESNVKSAINILDKSDVVKSKTNIIRIEDFN